MNSLAHFTVRRRWWVIGAWLALLAALLGASLSIGSAYSNEFSLPRSDSTSTLTTLAHHFPAQNGDTEQVVAFAPGGIEAQRSALGTLGQSLGALPGVKQVHGPFEAPGQLSLDGHTAIIAVTLTQKVQQVNRADVARLVARVQQARRPGLRLELSGLAVEEGQRKPPGQSELLGLLAAAVVLALTFGSLTAMSLPLVVALCALGAGSALVSFTSHFLPTAVFAPDLAALIGLGVGIDYALFIVTRYKQALARGSSVEESVTEALETSGRAVLFAGVVVCIALLGMLAMRVSFLEGVGVAASLMVLTTMAASLTLLPALLGAVGKNINRFGITRPEREHGAWKRWSKLVQRRPRTALVAALVVIGTLAVPTLGLRLGSADAGTAPRGSTTREAYDLLSRGFGPGFNGPLLLTLESKTPERLSEAASIIRRLPGAAQVGPVVVSPDGRAALMSIYPTTGPQDARTGQLVERLRARLAPLSARVGGRVHVGGQTAIFADFGALLSSRLPVFIGVVVLLSFVLLMMVFRSLLVPLKAAACNLASIGAAFGVCVAVFQYGWLKELVGIDRTGPIEAFLPVMLFAILFGLSMDYEVFLVSRIYEEWRKTGDNSLAVQEGLAATGGTITAAASIMIVVFGSFVLGGERVIKLFGVGLAAAVLLDAVVIRAVLVPAVMELAGRANWYLPDWLERVLPRLRVEGPGRELAEAEEVSNKTP